MPIEYVHDHSDLMHPKPSARVHLGEKPTPEAVASLYELMNKGAQHATDVRNVNALTELDKVEEQCLAILRQYQGKVQVGWDKERQEGIYKSVSSAEYPYHLPADEEFATLADMYLAKDAADALWTIRRAREGFKAERWDYACCQFMHLGGVLMRGSLRRLTKEVIAGDKVRKGGREGNHKAHGTPEKKARHKAEVCDEFIRLIRKAPVRMQTAIIFDLHVKYGASVSTIRRWLGKKK